MIKIKFSKRGVQARIDECTGVRHDVKVPFDDTETIKALQAMLPGETLIGRKLAGLVKSDHSFLVFDLSVVSTYPCPDKDY